MSPNFRVHVLRNSAEIRGISTAYIHTTSSAFISCPPPPPQTHLHLSHRVFAKQRPDCLQRYHISVHAAAWLKIIPWAAYNTPCKSKSTHNCWSAQSHLNIP